VDRLSLESGQVELESGQVEQLIHEGYNLHHPTVVEPPAQRGGPPCTTLPRARDSLFQRTRPQAHPVDGEDARAGEGELVGVGMKDIISHLDVGAYRLHSSYSRLLVT
jgi:hypothetical protein